MHSFLVVNLCILFFVRCLASCIIMLWFFHVHETLKMHQPILDGSDLSMLLIVVLVMGQIIDLPASIIEDGSGHIFGGISNLTC